jgi:hypothetical protein
MPVCKSNGGKLNFISELLRRGLEGAGNHTVKIFINAPFT